EGRDVRLAQPGDALEDDVAHGWERGWRARDYPQDLARRRLLLQGLRQPLLEVADPRDSLRRRVVNERSLGFRLTLLGLCTATHQPLLASRSVAINDRLGEGASVSKPDGGACLFHRRNSMIVTPVMGGRVPSRTSQGPPTA